MANPVCKPSAVLTNSRAYGPGPLHFATVDWNGRRATFEPFSTAARQDNVRAVVVFARLSGRFVLADIQGRGWCVPSGRLEPGEAPAETAIRETLEETGAAVEKLREIGRYVLRAAGGELKYVPSFLARVSEPGPIPVGSESRGTRLAGLEDIPTVYWMWDALLSDVFAYANSLATEWGW